MDHGSNIVVVESKELSDYKSRIGLILLAVYSVLYAGFILINTLVPKIMAIRLFFGLNLAVVYGFGLILAAIILGLIYNAKCTKKENEISANTEKGEKA